MKPYIQKISENVSLEVLMPLIKERLDAGQCVRIHPYGTSMLPMLRQGKDSVVLSSIDGEPERYDVVLYQRKNGQYVLHRLIDVCNGYVFLGDNQFEREYGIGRAQMIARVTSFYRGDRQVSANALPYKLYCVFWCSSRGLRRLVRRGSAFCKRQIRRLFRQGAPNTKK